MGRNHRARWSAIGAAVAVSIGAGGLITFASAAGGTASTFSAITPCRLLDTRADGPATGALPPKSTPLGQGQTLTIRARGDFGNCSALSQSATGVVLNVTTVNSTAGSFLTVWPADKSKPFASSLNWVGGQAATPNQVTTGVDALGQLSLYNNAGAVDVIVDIVGMYEPASGGGLSSAGPKGDPGSAGAPGTVGPAGPPGTGVNVMTAASPDPTDSSGQFNSLVLDATGNPVVSHYIDVDAALALVGDLVLSHCNDPACSPGGDVTNTVDSTGDVGQFTSIALDSSGFPVISYYDRTNGDLKVAHCNDVNCAGSNESINTVDSTGDVGQFTSIALDPSGFPVISYYDLTNGNLKVAHCNDVNCAAGGDSIVTADASANDVGQSTSLAMTGVVPTVAYYDATAQNVRLLRCANANCTSGTPNTVANTVGVDPQNPSLALDASGFPVVSYLDDLGFVAVTHCNDVACAPGGNATNAMNTDPNGGVGSPAYTSIALDNSGFPVVSYFDFVADVLRVGRCLDANCVTSVVSTADNAGGSTGAFSSIVLDSAGNPIISSFDNVFSDLVITRCADPFCNPRRIRSVNG